MDEIRNTIMTGGDAMSARTLIPDLFDTGDPQEFSVADLVRAGAAFGIEAPGIRTALTRLKSGCQSAPDRPRPLHDRRYCRPPDRKSPRLTSSNSCASRMTTSA